MAAAATPRWQDLLVIDIGERGIFHKGLFEPFKKVNGTDLVVTRQVSTMINAGLPVHWALYVLSEKIGNP